MLRTSPKLPAQNTWSCRPCLSSNCCWLKMMASKTADSCRHHWKNDGSCERRIGRDGFESLPCPTALWLLLLANDRQMLLLGWLLISVSSVSMSLYVVVVSWFGIRWCSVQERWEDGLVSYVGWCRGLRRWGQEVRSAKPRLQQQLGSCWMNGEVSLNGRAGRTWSAARRGHANATYRGVVGGRRSNRGQVVVEVSARRRPRRRLHRGQPVVRIRPWPDRIHLSVPNL